MASFSIDLKWNRDGEFAFEKFSRKHQLNFSGSQSLLNSAAPEYFGDEDTANPEELLASALASCHMLTFLAIACKSGYIIDNYSDHADAILDKNEEGKFYISEIFLHPSIAFSGEKIPSKDQLKTMHDKAHRNCFVANSLKTKVHIQ